jgi:predicted Zn-dependent peptidase
MFSTAVSLALLPLLAPIGQQIPVGDHVFHRRTLSNGLEALAADDGAKGTISVFVVYAVGNRAETEATTGIAHLTEHSLFTGTKTTPANAHDAAVKRVGGESNAYTRDDFTAYYAHKIPPTALASILGMEADRMRGLTWGKKAFLNERERLRTEELHSNASNELQLGARRDFALWGGRGYGAGLFDVRGNTRGPTLTLAQVKSFYDAWYRPRNASVVVVGGDPKSTLDAIEKAFGGLPAGPRPPELPSANLGAGKITLKAPLSRQRREWVWVGPSLTEVNDRLALLLVAELCDKRKDPGGSPIDVWQGGRVGADLFVIAGTGEWADGGLRLVYDEIEGGGWSPAALKKAKTNLRNAFTGTPLRARPYFSLAVEVATLVASGHAKFATEFDARIDALTTADVERAAARWLTPERRVDITYEPTGKLVPLPDDVAGLKKAASEAQGSGELERAIKAYEKLLTLKIGRVDRVIFHYSLGSINRRLGRLKVARDQLIAGLKVVEYPALRDLLQKVEREIKAGPSSTTDAAPTSQPAKPKPAKPTSRPTSKPAGPTAKEAASGHKVKATTGTAPPAWAKKATGIMGQLEGWRRLPFKKDLVVEFLTEQKDGPAGWYEPTTGRLVVTLRGTERFGQGTMLHEMFHALQDQHYGLVGVHRKVTSGDGDRAARAMIEGEAMLAVQELMDYDFSRHAKIPKDGDLDEERFAKVFHYGSGLQFILAVRKARGWAGVQKAFSAPPRSSAEIFHPERYLKGWTPLRQDQLPAVTVAPEESLIDSVSEGEYGLRVFLSRDVATRPMAPRVGAALMGEVHHRIKLADGSTRHEWQLRFRKANDGVAQALRSSALLAPGTTKDVAPVVERKGQLITLSWRSRG